MFSGFKASRRITPILIIAGICLFISACNGNGDWRTASRDSAGIAPLPQKTRDAVVQVYAADAWSWRGWFAVHTWIATKPEDSDSYTVYEVVGWRQKRGLPVVRMERDIPDRLWYGEKPQILVDWRGAKAQALLDSIEAAVLSYPWPDEYRAFPGPNSNTFTAWIAREVPGLELYLPLSAIGSGYVTRYNGDTSDS